MEFEKYMDSILTDWKILFSEDEIGIFRNIYVGIYRFEEHIASMQKNGTVPSNFVDSAKKELGCQLEAFRRMVFSCIDRDQIDENVPRETL